LAILSLEDLIINKSASGRPKDLLDLILAQEPKRAWLNRETDGGTCPTKFP
jgi:hypothetical protein